MKACMRCGGALSLGASDCSRCGASVTGREAEYRGEDRSPPGVRGAASYAPGLGRPVAESSPGRLIGAGVGLFFVGLAVGGIVYGVQQATGRLYFVVAGIALLAVFGGIASFVLGLLAGGVGAIRTVLVRK